MQTFLPYESFTESAKVLDNKRLGKQRVEGYQILRVLMGITKGWANHPAVKMWRGYEHALACYIFEICDEWTSRGFKDTIKQKVLDMGFHDSNAYHAPEWFGDINFHSSHRSNLLRKDKIHYGQFGWKEPDDLPYFWPTKETT